MSLSFATGHSTEQALAEQLLSTCAAVKAQIEQRVVGQSEVVEQLLITLLASGHALFVGVPGLAKTLLVRSLAASCTVSHKRLQFTPDLMPADITGTEILRNDAKGQRELVFAAGPVFANLILADEINRAPPKTQAALLECMQEGHVTSQGVRHRLPEPFHVFATQNPVEQEGTFSLPEAQLDRFMMAIWVDYPQYHDEVALLAQGLEPTPPQVGALLDEATLLAFQGLCRRVPVPQSLVAFAARIARATRPSLPESPEVVQRVVSLGAGPRAVHHLLRAAQAKALLHGRFAVDRQDLVALAKPALAHRLVLTYAAESEGVSASDVVALAIETAGEPT